MGNPLAVASAAAVTAAANAVAAEAAASETAAAAAAVAAAKAASEVSSAAKAIVSAAPAAVDGGAPAVGRKERDRSSGDGRAKFATPVDSVFLLPPKDASRPPPRGRLMQKIDYYGPG
jgi:hypothetical protein